MSNDTTAELMLEWAGLHDRMKEIEVQLGIKPAAVKEKTVSKPRVARVQKDASATDGADATAAKPAGTGRRGRPAGSSNTNSLGSVLLEILEKNKEPMELNEFVKAVLASGYKTTANNFTNVVTQALTKLTKQGKLSKDTVDGGVRKYAITKAA